MITDKLYREYLDLLLKGDRSQCTRIVKTLLEQEIDIKDLYLELFQTSLYDVGALWESNKISVAREHLATAITEGLLNLVYPDLFSEGDKAKTAVISCTANEYHQVGGKIVADFCELNGWNAHFLGANTPFDQLLSFIDEIRPDLVGLSMSIHSHLPRLKEGIDAIRSEYPRLDLIVGGQGFRNGISRELAPDGNIAYVRDLDELERILRYG